MLKRFLALAFLAFVVILRVNFGVPTPNATDVYHLVNKETTAVKITGIVESRPKEKMNKRGQKQFSYILKVQTVNDQSLTGKVWVSSYLEENNLNSPEIGNLVTVKARLRKPQNLAQSEFDFVSFLTRKGIFTTAYGSLTQVKTLPQSPIAWLQSYLYQVQSRFITPEIASLQLAMVVGDRAVELSPSLEESFRSVGLSHVMVVSGFQIVLILSTVAKLTRRLSSWQKFLSLTTVAIVFLTLTGIQPSIARATVMALLPYLTECLKLKLKPIESVFWAGGLLLLVTPMWVYELGFQLSFLATLGLVTCTNWLISKLEFLPPTIAEIIATPIVAMIWVQPLILTTFGTFPTYGLIANILSAPLVQIITLGGFITTLISLIPAQPFLLIAGGCAWLLSFPTQLLIGLAHFLEQAPFAVINFQLPIAVCWLGYVVIVSGGLWLNKGKFSKQ